MEHYGWRPRRTLIFVSFGGSEFGNIGSTEWVEQYLPLLKNRVVSYIDVGTCVRGEYFNSTASIPLRKLIIEALKNVRDPKNPGIYECSKIRILKVKKNFAGLIL